VLAKHLPSIAEAPETSAAVREVARLAKESYDYPVDVQIFSADGRLRARNSAHRMLSSVRSAAIEYDVLLDAATR
jgi:hypothetical protein